jgi:hypothetical protein
VGTVGKAVALAQIEVDPAGEFSTEQRVEDQQRSMVGGVSWWTFVTKAQLGLDRIGSIDNLDCGL